MCILTGGSTILNAVQQTILLVGGVSAIVLINFYAPVQMKSFKAKPTDSVVLIARLIEKESE